jgi:hypothetical protein
MCASDSSIVGMRGLQFDNFLVLAISCLYLFLPSKNKHLAGLCRVSFLPPLLPPLAAVV